MKRVLTYDSEDIYEDGTLNFWLVSGLDDGVEVRGQDTVIPGTAGRIERARVYDRRAIEIQGWVRGTDGATLRSSMETLRTLFDPTRDAATLEVLLEDESATATISCRPLPETVTNYLDAYVIGMSVRFEAIGDDWVVTPGGS